MNVTTTGPRLSDDVFFNQLVDTSLPGMEGLPEAAARGDYAACRKIFAQRVRSYLRPDLFYQLESDISDRVHGRVVDSLKAAEDACRNLLTSTGTPYQFGEEIDWTFNPTFNQYVEWTWQLNRHPHWSHLAKAYRQTGDEKYARCFARQFAGWVRQAVVPEDTVPGNETKCWRSIETGLRSGGSFPNAIHAFYRSPSITDELLVDFYKSVWEHGHRLETQHMSANWLIMEMSGLGQIALFYPELKDGARWYRFAIDLLLRELREQIHPDGMQAELSTGYQFVVIDRYMALLRAAEVYGHPLPQEIYDGVERMLEALVYLSKPDGTVPQPNDSHGELSVPEILSFYAGSFPQNQLLQWAASGGTRGQAPDFASVALPYAGFAVLRTGWDAGALYAIFDGGPFGMCHQHQDKLNLVVYANGHYVLPEAGVYAYDISPMRRYAISTRGHNTARVNGMDQNRQAQYRWSPSLLGQPSGMEWAPGEKIDAAFALYNEGYSNQYVETAFQTPGMQPPGPADQALYKGATHSRRVMLVKQPPEGLLPFLLVVDRLESSDENEYEILWHMGAQEVTATALAEGQQLQMPDFTLLLPAASEGAIALSLVRGATTPEWQGWQPHSMQQGDYAPAWVAKVLLHGKALRCVTLLYPAGAGFPVTGLEASTDVADTQITLRCADGAAYRFAEGAALYTKLP